MVDSITHGRRSRTDSQLSIDRVKIADDGSRGDPQSIGDLSIGKAGSHEVQYLKFTPG